jgi:hypothetical protein
MTLKEYLRGQMLEASSPENKWYCSQYFGYEVTDPKILLEYYIKHGGTQRFAREHQKELCDGRH